jgi:hypothetical protein
MSSSSGNFGGWHSEGIGVEKEKLRRVTEVAIASLVDVTTTLLVAGRDKVLKRDVTRFLSETCQLRALYIKPSALTKQHRRVHSSKFLG